MKKQKKLRFAIVVSRFNEEVTGGLLMGARRFLAEKNIKFNAGKDLFLAPGAFEIPLIAKKVAKTDKYDGVICLGCVVKGDTAHFEFISLGASVGIQMAALEAEIPITFGVLTTYSMSQAIERSKNDAHNKGIEAAAACYEACLSLSN